MKYYKYLILLVFCSCQNIDNNKSENLNQDLYQNSTDQKINNIEEKNWIDLYPNNIKSIRDSFYRSNINRFNCSLIDEFYIDMGSKLNTKKLVKIDSINCLKLFGDATSDYGDFCESYLYSIEKPFMGFYPITVIQGFGVAESPIILVIFDSKGKFINSIEVAASYGETGGCLESEFINDSTLIRKSVSEEFGVDSVGNDISETYSITDKVTFQTNGKFKITEIKEVKN